LAGNFIHRTLTFINTQFNNRVPKPIHLDKDDEQILKTIKEKVETIANEIEDCKLQAAINNVINMSRNGNRYLNENAPWKVIKKNINRAAKTIYVAAQIVALEDS